MDDGEGELGAGCEVVCGGFVGVVGGWAGKSVYLARAVMCSTLPYDVASFYKYRYHLLVRIYRGIY